MVLLFFMDPCDLIINCDNDDDDDDDCNTNNHD